MDEEMIGSIGGLNVVSDVHCPTWTYDRLTGWRWFLWRWMYFPLKWFKRTRHRYFLKCGNGMLVCSPENYALLQKTVTAEDWKKLGEAQHG
jgi:hypothetical protein